MIPKPGIYPGVPFEEYAKWQAVNISLLITLQDQSPFHAKYYQEHPAPETPALTIGSAAHCLALEPDTFKDRYVVAPKADRRTKDGKERWAAFEVLAGGKSILTADQYDSISAITEAISHQVVHRFIRQGEAEVCLVWQDKKTGLLCKGRLDYVHRDKAIIIDLKTTADASPDSFQRAIWAYRYHRRAAFYVDGWKALTGDDTAFVWMPIEKNPPYAIGAYEAHENTIWAGRLDYRKALERYAECVKANTWPAYGAKVEMINLSDWQLKESGVNAYQELRE